MDSNSKPTHLIAHAVRKFKDKNQEPRSQYTKIGALLPIKGGYRLVLDFIPLDPTVDILFFPPPDRTEERADV